MLVLFFLEPVVPGPALDGNGIGDEEAARVEDTESQEAAGPAVGVKEIHFNFK